MRSSIDRSVLRAYQTILDTGDEVTVAQRKDLRAKLNNLYGSTIDDRVKLGVLKQIYEIDKQIADNEWKIYEHENPATQKSEVLHKGLPEPPKRMEVVIVNATNKW
jgi:hypothetical protein